MHHSTSLFIILVLFLAISAPAYPYLKKRLLAPIIQQHKQSASSLHVLLIILIASPFLAIPLRFIAPTNKFFWFAYFCLGFSSFLVTLVFLRDLGMILAKFFQKLSRNILPRLKDRRGIAKLVMREKQIKQERKDFLLAMSGKGIFATASLLSGYGLYEARKTPPRVKVEVPIVKLPRQLDGFKICQATDIHAGLTIQKSYIERIAQSMNESKADVIAITGDLVDGSVSQLQHIIMPLQKLKARFGTYFVTGNHEYYSGAAEWIAALQQLGFKVLQNEHVVLKKNGANLILAGVTDYAAHKFIPSHRSQPKTAIQNCQVTGPKILLAHRPRNIFEAAQCGYDLQLSGHTHGGQLFPWNFVVKLIEPYTRGLHRHGKTWIYVSKGTGYWGPPMRVGASSEITEIILRAA